MICGHHNHQLAELIWKQLRNFTHCHLFPQLPTAVHKKQAQFMQIVGLPGVVGAIDAPHIKIRAPSINVDVIISFNTYWVNNVL